MAKKVYEIEVNNENLTNTSKSKAKEVKKSVVEAAVEPFGVVEINTVSAAKKMSKKADAGYEKNITISKKKQIKTHLSEVEDYADFCFRKTAKPVKSVEADVESVDILEYIREVLAVNTIENNDVKKKIATPSKSGDNDGLAEYYSLLTPAPAEPVEIDSEQILDYIRAVINFSVAPKDEVEAKIMKPSASSENEGLAEYYYNRVVGEDDVKDDDYYDIIEYIKEVLNYTAEVDAEIDEMIESQDKTCEKKTVKTKKSTTAKATTKKVAKKTTKKAKKVATTVYKADIVEDACANSISNEAEEILSMARLGSFFDLEKPMLN